MHVGKVVYALTGISLCGFEMTILNNSPVREDGCFVIFFCFVSTWFCQFPVVPLFQFEF